MVLVMWESDGINRFHQFINPVILMTMKMNFICLLVALVYIGRVNLLTNGDRILVARNKKKQMDLALFKNN